MKKIFSIAAVLFIAQACSGESKTSTESKTLVEKNSEKDITQGKKEYSLEELLEMMSFDHDRFDSYALEKGYYFDNSDLRDDIGDAMVYTYLNKENNTTLIDPLDFRLIRFSDFINDDHWALTHCIYKTSENKEYVEFKRQLKQNSFVYYGTRGYESTMCLIYKKGPIDILLETNKMAVNGETKNIYQIGLILHRNSQYNIFLEKNN